MTTGSRSSGRRACSASVGLGWSGLSAALAPMAAEWSSTGANIQREICVAILEQFLATCQPGSDCTIAERGTIWPSPPGPERTLSDVSAQVSQVLYITLRRVFSGGQLGYRCRCGSGAHILAIRESPRSSGCEIAFAIVSEMRTQTAGSRLLAETLAVSLAARLVHSHSGLS
jgi:AraC family transcriptional regulator